MKRILAGLFVCAAAAQLQAALISYDSFNYSSGSLGSVGSPTWTKQGTSPDPTVQNTGGLTFPGLLVSSDTMTLQYDGSGVNAGSGAPAATDATSLFGQPYTIGSVYYSLLLKVPAVQTAGGNGFATGVNLTQGSFAAGLQTLAPGVAPTQGATAAPLLIRSGDQVNQFASTFQLGTSKTATAADRQFYTGQAFSTGPNGETVFVVLKYNFDSINGDSASLYINPTPGGAEPAPQLEVATGAALTLNSGLQSFFVRNNSVEPDTMLIDELRVGTSWADVTPAVPEPATTALLLIGAVTAGCVARRRTR